MKENGKILKIVLIFTFLFIGLVVISFLMVGFLLFLKFNKTELNTSSFISIENNDDSLIQKLTGRSPVYLTNIPDGYEKTNTIVDKESKNIILLYRNSQINEGVAVTEYIGDIPTANSNKVDKDNMSYYFNDETEGMTRTVAFKKNGLSILIRVSDKKLRSTEELLKIASSAK